MDWIAQRYDVLNVFAGAYQIPLLDRRGSHPQDNFNGLTVGYSEKAGTNTWHKVGAGSNFDHDAYGDRTSIDILAPSNFDAATVNNGTTNDLCCTSYSAPLVTGTAAKLHQFAGEKRKAGTHPGWNASFNSTRHEVMKAVLMNSADKIKDDGMTFPEGHLLGMSRTVRDQFGSNWLNTDAYFLEDVPLDEQMGVGHLNSGRALRQFASSEQSVTGFCNPGQQCVGGTTTVAPVGWSYGTSGGQNSVRKYAIDGEIIGGSFISATLAFDRKVGFAPGGDVDGYGDLNGNGLFEIGDSFRPSHSTVASDDMISDLDIYVVPKGYVFVDRPSLEAAAVAQSWSKDNTVDHVFGQIQNTGEYEVWVYQFDQDAGAAQPYALAWWAATDLGDFNHDGLWDADDINALSAAIANNSTDLSFDLTGDLQVDQEDVYGPNGWLAVAGGMNGGTTGGNPFLPGDANMDGFVDVSDLNFFTLFTSTTDWTGGDFNFDGFSDISDLNIWGNNSFRGSSWPSPENVMGINALPEPDVGWTIALSFCLAILSRTRGQK